LSQKESVRVTLSLSCFIWSMWIVLLCMIFDKFFPMIYL
jgi:hypothetical protein